MNRDAHAHFTVVYHITADDEHQAGQLSEHIRVEQSVEMPVETVPGRALSYLPEILSVDPIGEKCWETRISFPLALVGSDATQILNVLFGNISLLRGIKIVDAGDDLFDGRLPGPSFGITGIRELLGIHHRPLSCIALKPVGLSPAALAERALAFSKGGADIIKDDHGLTDQDSAPFRERTAACVKAVRRGEETSGKRTLYFPNITTRPDEVINRCEEAAKLGADGVLICPQLCGPGIIRSLAESCNLPVMAHPSFSGIYINQPGHGFAPGFYYGKIWRAFGADAVIYPNTGGRFSFTEETCIDLNRNMRTSFCGFRASFPTPGGGINLRSIPRWMERYGRDTLFLIGGSLYQQNNGLRAATGEFQQMLEQYEASG